MKTWYDWVIAALLLAAAADVFFGLDAVLNAVSLVVVIGFAAAIVIVVMIAVLAFGWIVVRDEIHDIRDDRQLGRPWRARCVGWIGIAGMLVDGSVAAWNAYQQHMLFSTAVEQIPLVGVPVFLALGSYPASWLEGLVIKWVPQKQ
jgi:hypothetical protein